jgi:RecB family endonuclease NucS
LHVRHAAARALPRRPKHPPRALRCRAVRLIVARLSCRYTGRLNTELPEALRLLMIKADGTVMIWADGGGSSVKPLNCGDPPPVDL